MRAGRPKTSTVAAVHDRRSSSPGGHRPPLQNRRAPSGDRGAVLIVALIVAAVIALVLGSYLTLNLSSSRLAKRTFNGYAALNLAEAGAEEALWSFNRKVAGDGTAWAGWTSNGSSVWQKLPSFDFGQNTSGWVKVYVDNNNPPANAQPKIVTQSSIGAPGDIPVTKMLEVTLRRRSFFAGGLVAKDSVAFNGAVASVDSWDSDPDDNAATAPIEYGAGVRRDGGSVASSAVVNTAVLVNQANVWGYVATGGADPQVGKNGTIRGVDTPVDVPVDPRRVSKDFNADFPLITAPLDGTPLLSVGATLGTEGEATRWRTTGIELSGNQTLTILGDVTLILTANSGTDAITMAGNSSIIIPESSTLTIYAAGNVKIAGKGLANSNVQPISCQIWGTNQTVAGQQIDVVGNGALRCVLYAPAGDVTIRGNGDVMGSVIARTITISGEAAFHYDESLGRRENNEPFGIMKWRELTTAADRAPFEGIFQSF